MANLIQIKRSTVTAVPASLANGELAYTSNGNVLYIGSEGSVVPIAGSRNPGTLTANQALVANSSSGINKIITSNAVIGAITANGSLGSAGYILTSNGSGIYWEVPAESDFTITGDSGSDTFNTGETLNFSGNTGITTAVTNNQVDIDLDDTAVTPGSYGDANSVSTFTVDQQGRLTAAGTTDINHDTLLNFVADEHVAHSGVNLTAGSGLTGGGNITASRTFNVGAGVGVTVNADDVAVNPGNGITANSSGTHVEVSGDSTLVANSSGLFVIDSTIDHDALTNFVADEHVAHSSINLTAGNGLTGGGTIDASRTFNVGAGNGVSVSADAVAVNGGSTLTVNSTGVHVNNDLSITNLTLSGNLDINGTLTTIDTQNLSVNDSIIELARSNAGDTLDIGFYGTYNDGAEKYTGFFRDQNDSGIYKLFTGLTSEPTTTVDTGGAGYAIGTLEAYLNSGALVSNSTATNITANSSVSVALVANTLTLSSPLGISSGGTGLASVGADGLVLQSNGSALVYDSLDGGTF
jgi:hypothetical protein